MRGRVGTKEYDTEKADLIETLPDGIQVYRKKSVAKEFFLYNPAGTVARERFFQLPHDQAMKYIPENTKSRITSRNGNTLRFSPYDLERIRQHAVRLGMPANRFVLMLVDRYEQEQK